MNIEDHAQGIEQARREVLTWLLSQSPGQELTDAELLNAVGEWGRNEYALQLQTEWNEDANAFESRWVYGDSLADWFEQPFAAATTGQSQMLACAGLLRVVEPMYST